MSDEEIGREGDVAQTAPAKVRGWILGVIGVIVVITQFFDETDILFTTAQAFWCKWVVDCSVADEYTEFILDASLEMNQPFLTEEGKAKKKWDSLNESFKSILVGYPKGTYAVRVFGGGECNSSKATKRLVNFGHEDSEDEIEEKIQDVTPSGDPDLTRALFAAIDDFGSDKDTVQCNIRVISSGLICNNEPSAIERIKQKVREKEINLDFKFVALAPTGEALMTMRTFADSLGAKVWPVYDPVMLAEALVGNEDNIFEMAVEYYDDAGEEEIKALVYFEYLGDGHIEAAIYRAEIHLNRNGDFYDDTKALELLSAGTKADNKQAAYLLGMLYNEGGETIEKNTENAKKWLTKAAELGHEEAKQIAGKL